MRKKRRGRLAAFSLGLLALPAACNAVLGNDGVSLWDGSHALTDSGLAEEGGADSGTDSSALDSGHDSSTDSSAAESGADSSGSTSIARVQSVAPGWVSAQETTLTLAEENAGDLLVAGVYFDQSTVTITVADSLGNAWTPTTAYANITPCPFGASGANASVVQIFYAEDIVAGSNVVTVTQSSGTSPLGAFLVEYSGLLKSGSLDGISLRFS